MLRCASRRSKALVKHGTHIPRKRFGQHFLADQGIIDAIVQAIDPKPGDAMVEVGPGLAALTQPLVERLGALTVIELDRDLAQRLRSHNQLTVATCLTTSQRRFFSICCSMFMSSKTSISCFKRK